MSFPAIVEVVLTAAALVVAGWMWGRQWAAAPARPGGPAGALGIATKVAIGPSDRDTIGLACFAGVVLASWLGARLVELSTWFAAATGLDAAVWAPAGADSFVVPLAAAAGFDVVVIGLWRGVRVLEWLRRTRLGRRWPGLLGPALRHSIFGLLLPALLVAGGPLVAQTTVDAVSAVGGATDPVGGDAVGGATDPAACALADQAGDTIAGFGPDRLANAEVIVDTGTALGVPERGQWIALAAAMQETSLRNIDWGDRDSLGLFQQRPSQDWGAPAEILDPVYAATQFYERLVAIPGWEDLPLWQAAQAVQRSGHPTAYSKWEDAAAAVLGALTCASGRS
jgi:hypothetical protein